MPVVGFASVALRRAASAAEVGRHRGVSGGEAGWRDGWRRLARVPVTGTGVCRSGCVRSPTSPFPRPRVGCRSSGDVQGRMYAAVRRSGVFLWCKVDLFGWSWGCLDVGRRPWRRETRCSWGSARLGCGRAAMVTRVAWLVMFGVAWWFGGGLTPKCITCPVFSGRRWRRHGRRFLHEGSVVVFSSLLVAPGENLISVIGRWRLSVSCPS